MLRFLCLPLLLIAAESAMAIDEPHKPIAVGMIGLDTSHCVAFTELWNNPQASGELAGIKVVAAFPGGSPDIPESRDRVAGFTDKMTKLGVEIVGSIEELLPKVDAVLVESVDGRPHLDQVRPVIKARKPLFIDKPLAGSLADAVEIYRLAKEAGVPCFSSSALRFSGGIIGMRGDPRVGEVLGCEARGPCPIEPHHPDLFWYGIHGVETLFTIMGPGCKSVTRVHTEGTELVVGVWKDGRVGTFRGIRTGAKGYGATVFGSKGIVPSADFEGYKPLVVEISRFFRTGKPPVSAEETLQIYAFMEAADQSKRQGGAAVSMDDVLSAAKGRSQK